MLAWIEGEAIFPEALFVGEFKLPLAGRNSLSEQLLQSEPKFGGGELRQWIGAFADDNVWDLWWVFEGLPSEPRLVSKVTS